MNTLNDRQREFARLLATGMKQASAYRQAFDCEGMPPSTVASNASRLAKNADIQQYLANLRREADTPAILDRQQRMVILSQMTLKAMDAGNVREAVACIAELNRMDGAYAPEKVQVSGAMGIGAVVAALQAGEAEPLVRS